jgi:predicted DNA-binding transcriptional regulator AlpA
MPPFQRDPDTDQPQKKKQLMSTAATPPTPQQRDDDYSPDDRHDDDAASARPPLARFNVRSAPLTTIHRRQGDRSSADDYDAAPAQRLPIYVRFADLAAAGIVRNWPTLLRLMDEDGFPHGILLGRNTRVWALDEVEAWLATRPTARKTVPGSKQKELETTA